MGVQVQLPPDHVSYSFVDVPPIRIHQMYVAASSIKGTGGGTERLDVSLPAELPPQCIQGPPYLIKATEESLIIAWSAPKLRGLEVTNMILRRKDEIGNLQEV